MLIFALSKKNSYGFVMENVELGFKAMFIFQERVTSTGELIAPSTDEEQGDAGTQTAANTSFTSAPNLTEN